MTIFTDDFERANGGLGANWTTVQNNPAITSGNVGGTTVWLTVCSAVSENGRHEARCHIFTGAASNNYTGLVVKGFTGAANGYCLTIVGNAAPYNLVIHSTPFHTGAALATYALPSKPPPYVELRLIWDAGHLSGYLDGSLLVEADDATWAAGQYMGLSGQSNSAAIADFVCSGGTALGLAVDPNVIGNYGSCVTLTLTGTGTAWTPGTPGSPTFTVDHGTISAQTVDSATSATLTYCPGSYLGSVTFTDPSTGQTVGAIVTSDVNVVPPTGGDTWAPYKTLVDATGTLFDPDWLLTDQSTIFPEVEGVSTRYNIIETLSDIWHALYGDTPPGSVTSSDWLIPLLWQLINGAEGYTEGQDLNSLLVLTKANTDQLQAFFKLSDPTYATIDDVVGILGGSPTVLSHQDLKTAIDNIQAGDNQDILDALAAYFGQNPPTIEQLGTMVSDLATIAGYNLGDVLDAVAAIPTNSITSLQPVLDRLDDIQPSGADTLTTIQASIVPSSAIQAIVDAGTLALAGEEGATIAAVLDAINALQPGAGTIGPPVWPGAAGVTLGDAVALVDQLHLEVTCDGVIIAVTTPPERVGRYLIGGATMDYGVGRIAFETDSGDIESWQYLGFRSAIYTPKTMAHAAGVRLQVLGGAAGTVTPWTVST